MTNHTHVSDRLLAFISSLLLLLPFCTTGCTKSGIDDQILYGCWRIMAYQADDGLSAPIGEHQMDMIFSSTHVGEAQLDDVTQYM